MNLSAEKLHTVDIQGLPFGVYFSHEYLTLEAHVCCNCRSSNTVLTGAGLSNDTGFTHFLGEKALA